MAENNIGELVNNQENYSKKTQHPIIKAVGLACGLTVLAFGAKIGYDLNKPAVGRFFPDGYNILVDTKGRPDGTIGRVDEVWYGSEELDGISLVETLPNGDRVYEGNFRTHMTPLLDLGQEKNPYDAKGYNIGTKEWYFVPLKITARKGSIQDIGFVKKRIEQNDKYKNK